MGVPHGALQHWEPVHTLTTAAERGRCEGQGAKPRDEPTGGILLFFSVPERSREASFTVAARAALLPPIYYSATRAALAGLPHWYPESSQAPKIARTRT